MDNYRQIEGYNNYKISKNGDVYSEKTKKVLKKINTTNGYQLVNLYENKKKKSILIHQLMAITFLNHKPCFQEIVVDHINGNKKDNRLLNLQIISQRKNSTKDKSNQKSGYAGVYWSKQNKKWQVRPRINSRKFLLGYFDCPKIASEEYIKFCTYIDLVKKGKTIDEIKELIKKYKKM
jgi:hypothetical protein